MSIFRLAFPLQNHPRVKRVVVHKGYNPMLLADAYNV